jgi:predicted enzyme related to lactoylglutathione lyase
LNVELKFGKRVRRLFMAKSSGRFVWYELLTSNPEPAIRFYTSVLGWGTEEMKGGMPYTMITTGGKPQGGVIKLPKEAADMGAPPHWEPYISTPDVDATVKKAKQLGAKIYKGPMDVPGAGRLAVLADPHDALFAVHCSPGDEPGVFAPAVGQFSWHELASLDHKAALDFYGQLFGWEALDAMDMGEAGVYQTFGIGGKALGGIYNKSAAMPFPPHWLCYVRVADIDQAVEKIKSHGGKILNGPMDIPDGDKIAQAMDPQGAAFAIHYHKGKS